MSKRYKVTFEKEYEIYVYAKNEDEAYDLATSLAEEENCVNTEHTGTEFIKDDEEEFDGMSGDR